MIRHDIGLHFVILLRRAILHVDYNYLLHKFHTTNEESFPYTITTQRLSPTQHNKLTRLKRGFAPPATPMTRGLR